MTERPPSNSCLLHRQSPKHIRTISEAAAEKTQDMRNSTMERAHKKARKIMEELEGEGMLTLRALKGLLETEIENRMRGSSIPANQAAAPQGHTERIFEQLNRRASTETTT